MIRGSTREEVFPTPKQGIDTAPFWEACNRKELVIQECGDCGEIRHPPKPSCPECQSFKKDWREVSGTGEVYTYTITHYAASPAHQGHAPYNVAVILLDDTEDIRFVSQVVDTDPEDIEIGMDVEVVWDDVSDELTVPLFKPA
jgi:uncharacterized OB-fold protein